MLVDTPVQPPFALTVSAEARAVMEPVLAGKGAPEVTMALLRNPITRKAVRLAASNHLKPLNKARAKRFGVEVTKARSRVCRSNMPGGTIPIRRTGAC